MDAEEVAERLHELERKVLLALKKQDKQLIDSLAKSAGIDEASVSRAVLWLKSKGLVSVDEQLSELISLDENGKAYVKKGLPEKRFLNLIKSKPVSLSRLKASFSRDEFNVSIGLLRKNGYIKISGELISMTTAGKQFLSKRTIEEQLLSTLSKKPLKLSDLSSELKKGVNSLINRKRIIKRELKAARLVKLTSAGSSIIKYVKLEELIGQLTPEIISSGAWKKGRFRKYDLKAPVPRVMHGSKHYANILRDRIKQIFLEMGFKQVEGPLLELSFWNFDALFQPQDHPAREMHDTFFIKEPMHGLLPNKKLVNRVRRTHENGWTTGSTGWGYDWDESIASTNVMRTHTTGVSVHELSKIKPKDLPLKIFGIDYVFRNETVDYKHLFQFQQVEGIIADKNVNFRQLLGLLKRFFNKLGFTDVRFRPGYFPYTEMSVEPEVLHPVKKEWMELGGAGIFRPEVVKPLLGIEVPVLAWGLGFERLLMDIYNIKDIRDSYSANLEFIRKKVPYTRRL